jgi:hypothetical protein
MPQVRVYDQPADHERDRAHHSDHKTQDAQGLDQAHRVEFTVAMALVASAAAKALDKPGTNLHGPTTVTPGGDTSSRRRATEPISLDAHAITCAHRCPRDNLDAA